MSIQDIISLLALIVAIIAIPAAIIAFRNTRLENRKSEFLYQRAELEHAQQRLATTAVERAPDDWRAVSDFPMFTLPHWIPSAPYDIDLIALDWQPPREDDERLRVAQRSARKSLGLSDQRGYSDALVQVAGLNHLFNGIVYRPVEVAFTEDVKRIAFTEGRYFDYLDTSEFLAYETHLSTRSKLPTPRRRTHRKHLGTPFDLMNRSLSLGIDTLTVRIDGSRAGFLLHQRDPSKVVNNSGQVGVVPAGEFTPSDVTREAVKNDFSLWRNIMREYAEELLGDEDAQGRGGSWINYDEDPPYKQLNDGRATGEVRVKVLGLGIDPLTWKPELLTVCIIEASCFDTVFASMVSANKEGLILRGRGVLGLPFNADTIERYAEASNVSPHTKACLQLTWHHRATLGIPVAET